MRIFLILILLSSHAYAKDFSVAGHTFEILEENILKVIEARLQKIDLAKLNREMKAHTQKYIERPNAVEGITTAKESKVFFYDPTYTVPQDIKDHNGKLLHIAGTKINPLEHMPLSEALIFIDGDDKRQIEFALKLRKEKANKLKIILIKGSPLKLQKQHKVWIYFDQAGIITKKLGITQVLALVEQDGLRLKISVKEVSKL